MTTIRCDNYGDTGAMPCPFPMKAASRFMFAPLFDSSGNPTKIPQADIAKVALQLRFNEENPQDRLYPLPETKNITDERGEKVDFEWDSGGIVFIKENPRAVAAMIPKLTPELIGRLNKWNGSDMGYFYWDLDRNFVYNVDTDDSGDAYPIPIDGGSLYAGLVKATYTDPLMGALTFSTGQDVRDEDLRLIPASSLDFNGLSKTDVYGLQEINVTITAATATDVTFSLALDQSVAFEGAVVGDFVAHNDTNDTSITLSGVVESGVLPGTYVGSYAAGLAVGEIIRITVSKDKLSCIKR